MNEMETDMHPRRGVLTAMVAAPLAATMFSTANAQETGPDTMSETHPNIEKIQAFFTAYAAKDVGRVAEVLAPDIVWRIPGHHPLSGEKRGIEEVLAFFDQLARRTSRRSRS